MEGWVGEGSACLWHVEVEALCVAPHRTNVGGGLYHVIKQPVGGGVPQPLRQLGEDTIKCVVPHSVHPAHRPTFRLALMNSTAVIPTTYGISVVVVLLQYGLRGGEAPAHQGKLLRSKRLVIHPSAANCKRVEGGDDWLDLWAGLGPTCREL